MVAPVIMGALKGLLAGDGLIAKGLDFVNKRWPPNMSEADKAAAELVVQDMLHNHNMEIAKASAEDEKLFNERTIALEGTAKDLQTIPYVGGAIIFLRGAFRPLFSYFTAYMDYVYFSESVVQVMGPDGLLLRVVTSWTERQETLLLIMNLLVLVFFFGERAMKNVLPLIVNVFESRAADLARRNDDHAS